MSRITTGLLTNTGETTMKKKRVKKADGGMLYAGGSRNFNEGTGGSSVQSVPAPMSRTMTNPAGRSMPAQAMANAQGKPFQPGGKFNPIRTGGGAAPLGGGGTGSTGGGMTPIGGGTDAGPMRGPYDAIPPSVQALKKGGHVRKKAKGGSVEGSAKDTREDKAMAKKRGMSMAKWEASSADVEHDMPMKKRGGGIAKKGKGIALRGGGIATRGMGIALKKGGSAKKRGR